MKKKLAIILALLMTVSVLAACGGGGSEDTAEPEAKNENVIEPGKAYTIDDYAEFTLVKLETTSKITSGIDPSWGYECDEGKKYVDVIIDFKNLTDSNISSEKLFTVKATNQDGASYTCNEYIVEEGENLDSYVDIRPMAVTRIHCAITVAEGEKNLNIRMKIKDSVFTKEYTLNERIANELPVAVGDTIEKEDFAKIVLKDISFADAVYPTSPDYYYYYEVENQDNTYLAIKTDLTNLKDSGRQVEKFMGVKAIIEDKYTYTGFAVADEDGGQSLSTYETIDPLTTRMVYYLVEVPDSVKDKSIKIIFNFDGKEYVNNFQ